MRLDDSYIEGWKPDIDVHVTFYLTQMAQLISYPANWSIWLEGTVPLQTPYEVNGVHMPGAAWRTVLILDINN